PLRRYRSWIVAGVVVFALLAVSIPPALTWFGSDRSAQRAQLRFSEVRREDFVRDVSAQGVVVAAVAPTLYTATGGTVSLHVNAGDTVREGDLIATVESPELANELDREQATLESLETNLKRQEIENRKDIIRARQVVDLAQVELTAAERELRRAEQSWSYQVISLQDLEKAQDDVERARIALKHATDDAELNVESLGFDLETLRLERDRQRLTVSNLQRRVSELSLTAPVAGMVGTLAVDRRQVVAANAEIATVVDLSALEIDLSISDSYADDLVIGSDVSVKFAGNDHLATLISVSPEVVNSTVSARVRFQDEQPPGLRQNQRVSARIVLEAREDILVVDRGPFYDTGAGRLIYKVEGDVAERVQIATGATSVSHIEILDGLAEGDTVVISEIDRFRGSERVLLRN
ncbi:MAG: HlyD family efflux transporter periplasmic adaptor subunit, partial [Pseudomonadota bacterium]